MRLNLGCGSDIRNGYINVDKMPQGQMPTDVYRQGDMQSLDWLAESDSVQEIIAIDCLGYLPSGILQATLHNWYQKLAPNGILKILVLDCYAVATSFSQGQFDLEQYSRMLFGTQENNDNRISVIDTHTLIRILQDIGFNVTLKRYEGVAIYVEVVK